MIVNPKDWLQNTPKGKPMRESVPVDSSVTVLRTCCMAKLTKLSFDRSPLYFTAACWFRECPYFTFKRHPILWLNTLNDAEVLLLNNTVFLQMILGEPRQYRSYRILSLIFRNDFSSLLLLEVGKRQVLELYIPRGSTYNMLKCAVNILYDRNWWSWKFHKEIHNVYGKLAPKVRRSNNQPKSFHIVFSSTLIAIRSTNLQNGNSTYHSRPEDVEAGVAADSFHPAEHPVIAAVDSSDAK